MCSTVNDHVCGFTKDTNVNIPNRNVNFSSNKNSFIINKVLQYDLK